MRSAGASPDFCTGNISRTFSALIYFLRTRVPRKKHERC